MTGFESKRSAAKDKMTDETDTLLIVYQQGFADGKRSAERKPLTEEQQVGPVTVDNTRHAKLMAKFKENAATMKALAPPQQPEPTPWRDMVVVTLVREGITKHKARELADHFATPPQRQWVGLTDDEITELDMEISGRTMDECVRAIEAKLKAKNDH